MSDCLIGECPTCGALRLAIVDEPDRKKETAKEIMKAIRAGLIIKRVSVEYVRSARWKCECTRRIVEKVQPPEGGAK